MKARPGVEGVDFEKKKEFGEKSDL